MPEPNPRELDSFIMTERPASPPICGQCGNPAIIPVPIMSLLEDRGDGSYTLPVFLCCTYCGAQTRHDLVVQKMQEEQAEEPEEKDVQDGH
jgi:hypothetical protein